MQDTVETGAVDRTLAESIVIPDIRGEMVSLRAATWDDFTLLDDVHAFVSSIALIGKTDDAERAIIRSLVQRSLRWEKGIRTQEDGLQDAQARGVIAWSMFTRDPDTQELQDFIGMAFLIDIDAWSASARIHVILGENYRGRGYTRDVMPRVMTFGFAPQPAGLGLHRIWISTPSSNTRAHAVYQSLGFTESGVSRDALWDTSEERYMDMHIYDMLVDEYDPIRSLETFGLHAIMDNPGVKEALAQHEHTLEIRKNVSTEEHDLKVTTEEIQEDISNESIPTDSSSEQSDSVHMEISQEHPNTSEEDLPWWRKLGAGRKRS